MAFAVGGSSPDSSSARRFLVDPEGRQFLALTADALEFVELPEGRSKSRPSACYNATPEACSSCRTAPCFASSP
jgi:hypothetical protein